MAARQYTGMTLPDIDRYQRTFMWLMRVVFVTGFVLTEAVVLYALHTGDAGWYDVGRVTMAAGLYLVLGWAGSRKGTRDLFDAYDYVARFPAILRINFYAAVLIVGALLVAFYTPFLVFYLASVWGVNLVIMVILALWAVFLLLVMNFSAIGSNMSQGAVTRYVLMDEKHTEQAVWESLQLLPQYIVLDILQTLVLRATQRGGTIARMLLSWAGVPLQVLSDFASTTLTYSPILLAAEQGGPVNAITESMQLTLDVPEETTFLNLSLSAIILLTSIILIVPIIVSAALFVILFWGVGLSGPVAFLVATIPGITGIALYLYVGSIASSAHEVALVENYVEYIGGERFTTTRPQTSATSTNRPSH